MMWFFAILVVLAMGGVAAVAVGRGEPMLDEHPDRPDVLVPAARDLTGADLRAVRFPLALRGYRMADVDALLDRLAGQLAAAQAPAVSDPVDPSDPSDPAVEAGAEPGSEPGEGAAEDPATPPAVEPGTDPVDGHPGRHAAPGPADQRREDLTP